MGQIGTMKSSQKVVISQMYYYSISMTVLAPTVCHLMAFSYDSAGKVLSTLLDPDHKHKLRRREFLW